MDTDNIIHNRQRLRFSAIINISLVFLFLGIRDLFTQPHASWIHFLHFFVQPIVLIVSMTDKTFIIQNALFASIFIFCVDGFILFLNLIAISRCYLEPTAQCFDRIWESSVWIVLAFIFTFVDFLICFQLYNLIKQVENKLANPIDLKINARKIEILHIFLIPQDIIFAIITILRTRTLPIYWIGIAHIFIDPYVIWSGRVESREMYQFRKIIYIILLVLNIVLFILNLEIPERDVLEWLSIFIVASYVCIDVVLYILVEEVLDTYKTLKQL